MDFLCLHIFLLLCDEALVQKPNEDSWVELVQEVHAQNNSIRLPHHTSLTQGNQQRLVALRWGGLNMIISPVSRLAEKKMSSLNVKQCLWLKPTML